MVNFISRRNWTQSTIRSSKRVLVISHFKIREICASDDAMRFYGRNFHAVKSASEPQKNAKYAKILLGK
ncbi:MAG: hypothetical protein HC767_04655 [Akkermansiaceae bacterium]|nr:hypothetical protein [Akkermansiaceae bacterium]